MKKWKFYAKQKYAVRKKKTENGKPEFSREKTCCFNVQINYVMRISV